MEKPSRYSPERRAFDDAYRLRRINALRRRWGLPDWELHVESARSDVSIGIEIEMTWVQAFPPMRAEWEGSEVRPRQLLTDSDRYRTFAAQYDENDRKLRPVLEEAKKLIPRVGTDAYWEFSFLPTRNLQILEAEVSTLYDKDILQEGQEYATQLTLAGITTESDAAAILMIMETEGGTTLERLTKATGWFCKGTGGVHKRNANELLGGDTSAYELRTLVTTSPEQLIHVVGIAQDLAGLVRDDPDKWNEIKHGLKTKLEAAGLPWGSWPLPDEDADLWHGYCAAFISQ